jgi:hypothetical protein
MAPYKYSFFMNYFIFASIGYSSNSGMENVDEDDQKRDEEVLFRLFIIFWHLRSYSDTFYVYSLTFSILTIMVHPASVWGIFELSFDQLFRNN